MTPAQRAEIAFLVAGAVLIAAVTGLAHFVAWLLDPGPKRHQE